MSAVFQTIIFGYKFNKVIQTKHIHVKKHVYGYLFDFVINLEKLLKFSIRLSKGCFVLSKREEKYEIFLLSG